MWSALQHAKEQAVGFARRHKKVLVVSTVTAACAAGAYYAYNRMVHEAEKFTQQLQRQMAEHQRLQLSLASTTEESNAAVQRFLPRLKSKLYALVDLESVVQELKTLDKTQRSRRNALWEQAKLLALTRYFTALLAFGLWHLLVFAQVSIIGKRVFEKSKAPEARFAFSSSTRTEDDERAAAAAHHAFLTSGLEYFLGDGLAQIKAHVEHVVASNAQLKSWDVSRKAKVERDELNELLQSLFLSLLPSPADVHGNEDNGDALAYWRSFVIYSDKRAGQNEHVISLLNDLWDLLESDLFVPAVTQSLGFLCGNAFQDLNDVVYGQQQQQQQRIVELDAEVRDCSDNSAAPSTGDTTNSSKPAPPLAKLIPCLQTEISKLLSSGSASYVPKYSHGVGEMEAFRTFYEAIFFQGDDTGVQLI